MSAELSWFKSSYSDSSGSACLEVACRRRDSSPHTIHIRDSKLGPGSPRFAVPADAWAVFVAYASREA
ncbi:DUF397 domain-containing protein [Streptomyces sporangiiformans]|uniref:DUF397 domain-containing protein n=1 Tax=Streptomyces sporangiiformans TaxID=2315329 RepID=A0A505D0Q0_9ACTN|nr:DUF397 domain-containing protein [Streptomyces sporangiiformans]TPQ16190.1 DUF397 domain-containing protein [Streptomyces sporangiiformans]